MKRATRNGTQPVLVDLSSDEELKEDYVSAKQGLQAAKESFSAKAPRGVSKRTKGRAEVPARKKHKVKGALADLGTIKSAWAALPLRSSQEERQLSQQVASNPLNVSQTRSEESHQLWADKYAPTAQGELAVHKKKVEEVRNWLEAHVAQPGQVVHTSKVLLLTGPPGVGKSAVVRVLARELHFELQEWATPVPTLWHEYKHLTLSASTSYTSKFDDFESFLHHAEKFPSLPFYTTSNSPLSQKLLLVDDLPLASDSNHRHRLTRLLEDLPSTTQFPLVVILTGGNEKDGLAGVQQALERGGALTITFNPITATNIFKVLSHISSSEGYILDSSTLTSISETASGDLRQALATLQFHSLSKMRRKPTKWDPGGRSKAKRPKKSSLLDKAKALNGKDMSLSLFHALGKVLYNKREEVDGGEVDLEIRTELRRPKGQVAEEVLAQASLEASSVLGFLHENAPHFFDDEDGTDDLSLALHYLSDADFLLRGAWGRPKSTPAEDHSGECDPGRVATAASASVATRGLLFANVHPAPRRFFQFRAPVSVQVEKKRKAKMVELQQQLWLSDHLKRFCTTFDRVSLATEVEPYRLRIEALEQRWHGAARRGAGMLHASVQVERGKASSQELDEVEGLEDEIED